MGNSTIRLLALRFTGTVPSALYQCDSMLQNALKELPIEYCVSVCPVERKIPFLELGQQEWINSSPMKYGEYEGVDWNEVRPLDEELVEDMRECEATVMELFRRLEWKRVIPYPDRKRLYLRHLRFWRDFLEKKRINLFMVSNMPHEFPEYIIYELCRRKGIPTLILRTTPVIDTVLLSEDWEQPAVGLKERYEELSVELKDVPADDIQLAEKFEQYFQKQSNPEGSKALIWDITAAKFTWWGMVKNMFRTDKKNFFLHACRYIGYRFTPMYWKKRSRDKKMEQAGKKLRSFYDKHSVEPDLTKKYIYVALHYQPECTSCPMAGVFVDQVLMVQLIASCLPDDVYVYVKEHPKQKAHYRSIAYYQDLLGVKHVRLVARNVNTFNLRENCLAVATCTGTVGFEALFREKPVLMFGHNFYQYASGVFPIHTEEECRNAVASILRGEVTPTIKDIRVFLKALEEVSVEGALTDAHQAISRITPEENIQNVSTFLIKKITEALPRIQAVSYE